ncbi:MAG: hypothetical protein E7348_05190 [Clostridiales bacterium]|nr:hypothetical protein [Clostridiales bacterium]
MRKNIKKIFLIGIIAILFMIGGCTPHMFYYGKLEKLEIKKIQLIEYENPNVLEQEYFGFLFYRAKYEFEDFDQSKCTVLEELNEEDFEEFNTDMEGAVEAHLAYKRGHNGQGLRIIYSDGSFFVFTWEYLNSVNADGLVGYYGENGKCQGDLEDIDPILYMIIAANYFETKIG